MVKNLIKLIISDVMRFPFDRSWMCVTESRLVTRNINFSCSHGFSIHSLRKSNKNCSRLIKLDLLWEVFWIFYSSWRHTLCCVKKTKGNVQTIFFALSLFEIWQTPVCGFFERSFSHHQVFKGMLQMDNDNKSNQNFIHRLYNEMLCFAYLLTAARRNETKLW